MIQYKFSGQQEFKEKDFRGDRAVARSTLKT